MMCNSIMFLKLICFFLFISSSTKHPTGLWASLTVMRAWQWPLMVCGASHVTPRPGRVSGALRGLWARASTTTRPLYLMKGCAVLDGQHLRWERGKERKKWVGGSIVIFNGCKIFIDKHMPTIWWCVLWLSKSLLHFLSLKEPENKIISPFRQYSLAYRFCYKNIQNMLKFYVFAAYAVNDLWRITLSCKACISANY